MSCLCTMSESCEYCTAKPAEDKLDRPFRHSYEETIALRAELLQAVDLLRDGTQKVMTLAEMREWLDKIYAFVERYPKAP